MTTSAGEMSVTTAAVEAALKANPEVVENYRAGPSGASLGFLLGQVMRLTGGHADPALAQSLLRERLDHTIDVA